MLANVVAPSGGIESALVDLTRALLSAGHRVTVHACRPFDEPNQNVAQLRAAGATMSVCPAWLSRVASIPECTRVAVFHRLLDIATPMLVVPALAHALLRKRSVSRSLSGLRGKASAVVLPRLRLERLYYVPLDLGVRKRPPDVVHVHGWGLGIDPPGGLAWAHAQRLPTVYTEHNSPPVSAAGTEPQPSWLHLTDAVIACSRAGARGLTPACRAKTPIAVIPYSVSDPTAAVEVAAPSSRDEVVGERSVTITCLARLSHRHKGQDILLHAMTTVVERAPGTRLLMAGDGESRPVLEALASELGLGGAVEFLGHVPRARLGWLMAQSEVMVLPSRWEGLPVSIIESLAFGKPVVASEAGGNPELVEHGVTGLIVPVGDVDALAAALLELATDPARRAAMGNAARRRFDEGAFSPAAVAEATLAVYRAVVDGGDVQASAVNDRSSAATRRTVEDAAP